MEPEIIFNLKMIVNVCVYYFFILRQFFITCASQFPDWQMQQMLHLRQCLSNLCLCTFLCVFSISVIACTCGCVGHWVIGSCSLYFHEACSMSGLFPLAPCCPLVQFTLSAVSFSAPSWLYIIPTILSLGFLFVFSRCCLPSLPLSL